MAEIPTLTPEERDVLAAELALGVLDGEERATALRLQLFDPEFHAMVLDWQNRLDPLFREFASVEAPDLWPSIERRLGATGTEDRVVQTLRQRLRRWQVGTWAAGALAASLAAVVIVRPFDVTPPPVVQVAQPVVAQLGDAAADAQFLASFDSASGELRLRPLKVPQSALALELWAVPADNVPRSLGFVQKDGTTRVRVPAEIRPLLKDGTLLAVSLEDPATARHIAPSSAPIAAGQMYSNAL